MEGLVGTLADTNLSEGSPDNFGNYYNYDCMINFRIKLYSYSR
jgi:hypothetical protein